MVYKKSKGLKKMQSTNLFSFSIRDDDINFFTSAKELKEIYEPLFEICKPTLCITPFAGDVYKSVRDNEDSLKNTQQIKNFVSSKQNYEFKNISPIHKNDELVSLLRNWIRENKISIALHGITHNQTKSGYECEVSDNLKLLKTSKDYLESLFQVKIKTFSAPNNSIKKLWRNELVKLNMDLVTSYGPKPNEITLNKESVFNLTKLYWHFLKYRKKFFYPYPLKYKYNIEFASFPQSVFPNFEASIEAMKFCQSRQGNFILATHSYAFSSNEHMISDLKKIVLTAKKMGAVMKGIDEICKQSHQEERHTKTSLNFLDAYSEIVEHLNKN
jgi:hypothetical protein